jgi:hypothetical protein
VGPYWVRARLAMAASRTISRRYASDSISHPRFCGRRREPGDLLGNRALTSGSCASHGATSSVCYHRSSLSYWPGAGHGLSSLVEPWRTPCRLSWPSMVPIAAAANRAWKRLGPPAATRMARRQSTCRKALHHRRRSGTAAHRPRQPGRARKRGPSSTTTNDAARHPSSQTRTCRQSAPVANIQPIHMR